MTKEIKTIDFREPACVKRSDSDHLRFMVHRKLSEPGFDFTIELVGLRSWWVPDVPSMNPLDQREAEMDEAHPAPVHETVVPRAVGEAVPGTWDNGNYIPIDDHGNVLSDYEALSHLERGELKFFLQGRKLVGEFILLKKESNTWLLMKRHDEFALYDSYQLELAEG